MKAEYIVVLIRKDVMQETPVTVFPHEIQILYEVHGESNVNVIDPFPDYEAQEIEPDDEYARLERRYGVDAERNSMSFVELVYGKPFQKNLDKEIALGKDRIVTEDSDFTEPDMTETDLGKKDGLLARLKGIGVTYPPAARKKELEQILRHEFVSRITDATGKKPGATARLSALSEQYDEVSKGE